MILPSKFHSVPHTISPSFNIRFLIRSDVSVSDSDHFACRSEFLLNNDVIVGVDYITLLTLAEIAQRLLRKPH